MNTAELTLDEIRSRGYAALLRELGPAGYVRFIQQFRTGRGDYTAERHQWLDKLTMDDVKAMLERGREGKS
jgi:hypothetical protein